MPGRVLDRVRAFDPMIPIKNESAWKGTSDCSRCGIRSLGLFADLNQKDLAQFHAPIDDFHYAAGRKIYAERGPAAGIFTVRKGLMKLLRVSPDGRERVTRIVRPGDVAGLEALATNTYDSDAIALTDTALCRIPLDLIHRLSQRSPRLHMRLMLKWQQALKNSDDWLAHKTGHRAWQGALHSRHDDDDRGSFQLVSNGEQPVKPRDSDIGEADDVIPEDVGGDGGFIRHG